MLVISRVTSNLKHINDRSMFVKYFLGGLSHQVRQCAYREDPLQDTVVLRRGHRDGDQCEGQQCDY